MIYISNEDRDKAVEYIKAYTTLLQKHGITTTRDINARRLALNLAKKLERKKIMK